MQQKRTQLLALEGQRVIYTGRTARRITRPDGQWDICLTAVHVRPHRVDVAMLDVEPTFVDHVWLRGIEPSQVQNGELLRKMEGAATVGWYTRSNGTIDLGLESIRGADLDNLYDEIQSEKESAKRAGRLRSFLEWMDDGDPAVWAWSFPADQALDALRKGLARFSRSADVEFAIAMTATNNGPCRRMREALRLPKHQPAQARGFA
jgi:hypothetical protein